MKSIKTTLTVLLLVITVMLGISCKKENITPKTTQEKILGKWKIQSVSENYFFSGMPHVNTFSGVGEYADFRNDGKVYSFSRNNYDTAAYGIISDTKMWIDLSTDIFTIQTLTDAELKLYLKEDIAAGEYTETTLQLNK